MGVAKVIAEVVGKAITRVDMVRDVSVRYIVIESKAKVVDKGKKHIDEFREGQVGVVGGEGAPDPDGGAVLEACGYIEP